MINLLPKQIRLKRRYKKMSIICIIIFIMIVAVTSTYNYWTSLNYKERIININNNLEDLNVVINEVKRINEEKLLIKKKRNIINNLDKNINYGRIIEDLNIIIPERIWLNKFIISQNKVKIIAQTSSNHKIVEMISQLNRYPYFNKVDLTSTESREGIIHFKVQGRLNL